MMFDSRRDRYALIDLAKQATRDMFGIEGPAGLEPTDQCLHENRVVEMRGQRWLDDSGEVTDNIHEVEVCTDCGHEWGPEEGR